MRSLWIFALTLMGTVTLARASAPFDGSPIGAAIAVSALEADPNDASKENRVAILSGGYDALLLRVHLIRQARVSITVQTFIWTNDEVGRLMMYELIEAARRGVKVRIIADHLGSDQDPAITAFLATVHPNLELKHYRPALSRLKPSLADKLLATVHSFHGVNQRMHNKVMVFDGAVMITGGRNIENTYFDHSTVMNFRDRDVLAVGPVVRDAVKSFERFWNYRHSIASRELTDVAAVISRGSFRRYDRKEDYDFGPFFGDLRRDADDPAVIRSRFVSRLKLAQKVTFICDEPGKSEGPFSESARITRELGRTLQEARTSVVLQSPYLVLSTPAQTLFKKMENRNPALRIRISTNSFASTDNLFAYSANYRLRNKYVQDLHLEIHEFKPIPAAILELFPQFPLIVRMAKERIAAGRQERMPFFCIHAKSLVVDDRIAFIGSYNLDPRSESLNTEAGLLIEDVSVARELRGEIERDMRPENSWVIGRRALPLHLQTVNGLVGDVLSLSPIDAWPIQNTSSFELLRGETEVPPDDPNFHQHYREVGSFPGTEGIFTTKEILTRLYKVVGTPLTPIL